MKKEEIKAHTLKEDYEAEVIFRTTEIKRGRFESNAEDSEMYAKNEWYFIESPLNKKQLVRGNDIILIN